MSNAKLQGGASGTGSVTLLAPNTNNTDVLTLPDVAADTLAALAATQTLTNKTLGSGLVAGASYLTSGTAVASTSGTSITFSSIPSWVKRITVMFQGVSTSGTSVLQMQIGAGSVTNTGYLSGGFTQSGGGTITAFSSTTGFALIAPQANTNLFHGAFTICSMGSNTWAMSAAVGSTGGNYGASSGGSITLSGTLDRVVVTTVNGTDTFDAGSINILWE
jgi:hypothetical protein